MNCLTVDDMARIHAAAFIHDRPWTAAEIEALLAGHGVAALCETKGFGLVRSVAGETELLTLAVRPDAQKAGVGQALIHQLLAHAKAVHSDHVFLEVAADNEEAIRLYTRNGFVQTGRRKAYYARPGGASVDAVLMKLS